MIVPLCLCRTGHFARECPDGEGGQERGGGGGGGGGSVCYRCDRIGHFARECPEGEGGERGGDRGGFPARASYGGGGGGAGSKCYKCNRFVFLFKPLGMDSENCSLYKLFTLMS